MQNLFSKMANKMWVLGLCFFMGFAVTGLSQTYDGNSGATIYEKGDGSVVVYIPTTNGSTVLTCGPGMTDCEEIDCNTDRDRCIEELDKATEVKQSTVGKLEGRKMEFKSGITELLKSKRIKFR